MTVVAAACTGSSRPAPVSAPSSSSSQSVASCPTAQLSIRLYGVAKFTRQAGLAHDVDVASFAVTNHARKCEVHGYVKPTVSPARVRLGGTLPTGNDRPTHLVVPPGKSVNFSIEFRAARDPGCPAATVLRSLAFSDGLHWTAHKQRLTVCSLGRIRVGPLHTPVY